MPGWTRPQYLPVSVRAGDRPGWAVAYTVMQERPVFGGTFCIFVDLLLWDCSNDQVASELGMVTD